jgi:MinD superfamily P-loop ATPase
VNAISFYPNVAGSLNLYKDKEKVFSTAQLKMGNGTTGLLVSEVKKQLNNEAQEADFAIIDGSPGIGCPVIASISGMEMVLVVAEPSISGISDMVRVIEVSQSFGVKIAVCINKYDANKEKTREIIDYCDRNKIPFVGNIPYDSLATRALNSGLSIVEMACSSGTAVRNVYRRTMQIFSS